MNMSVYRRCLNSFPARSAAPSKLTAQLSGLQLDTGTEAGNFPRPHIGRGRNEDTPGRELAACTIKILDDAGAAIYFPLKPVACPRLFETGQQSQPGHRKSIADLNPLQPRHELPGASLAHANEFLDGLTVEVRNRHSAQLILD